MPAGLRTTSFQRLALTLVCLRHEPVCITLYSQASSKVSNVFGMCNCNGLFRKVSFKGFTQFNFDLVLCYLSEDDKCDPTNSPRLRPKMSYPQDPNDTPLPRVKVFTTLREVFCRFCSGPGK